MKVTVIDLTRRQYEPVLKMSGRTGKTYMFRWNRDLGRYAYQTDNQQELSDILEGAMHWHHTYFSVLLPPQEVLPKPAKPAAKRKPPARREPLADPPGAPGTPDE